MSCVQLFQSQGPLGNVWLAANYEKRLTKHQFLASSITEFSELMTQPHQPYDLDSNLPSSISLRVSGQLLLGIVRIYSRKTKYLLDDVNDILTKLKVSFRHATGLHPGSDLGLVLANASAQETVVPDINSLFLADETTAPQLFYQNDLELDDTLDTTPLGVIFRRVNDDIDINESFDQSIEVGRSAIPEDFGAPLDSDYGLDIDFDNLSDVDMSIEVGRECSALAVDKDASFMSIVEKELDQGVPLETLQDLGHNQAQPSLDSALANVTYRPRNATGGSKRKLMVDSIEELQGISISCLRKNQSQLLDLPMLTSVQLLKSEKLKLVYELSQSPILKRRRLWQMDTLLKDCSTEFSHPEADKDPQLNDLDNLNLDSLEFDLSLSDFEEERPMTSLQATSTIFTSDGAIKKPKSTVDVASQLRILCLNNSSCTLGELICAHVPIPVSPGWLQASPRKKAATCFFEILALSTEDSIIVSQVANIESLKGEITIGARAGLFSKFQEEISA